MACSKDGDQARAGAMYEGRYLLGAALARPLIAKAQVEAALAHGLPLFQPKSFRKPEVREQMIGALAATGEPQDAVAGRRLAPALFAGVAGDPAPQVALLVVDRQRRDLGDFQCEFAQNPSFLC